MVSNSMRLDDYRCECGKLLLKGIVFDGNLEIKCRRCGKISKIGEGKALNDAKHYVLIIDEMGVITNASESVMAILGYDPQELIGSNITRINSFLPKEINFKFFGHESILSSENSLQVDTIHKTKNGVNLPVSIILKIYIPRKTDKYILEYVTIKDACNQQRMDKPDSEEFIENACDYFFDVDIHGLVEYISQSMESLFDFTQEKVIGKRYFDFLPFTQIAKEMKTFMHFSDLEQSFRVMQNIGLDLNGVVISSDLYFTSKFNEVGKFVGYRVLGWVVQT